MENSSSRSVTDNACEFNGTSVQENWAQSDGVRAYGLWCSVALYTQTLVPAELFQRFFFHINGEWCHIHLTGS